MFTIFSTQWLSDQCVPIIENIASKEIAESILEDIDVFRWIGGWNASDIAAIIGDRGTYDPEYVMWHIDCKFFYQQNQLKP